MRQPRPARRARPRGQRWVLWFVLALLTVAPVVLCQAVTSSAAAPPATAAVTVDCDGAGHDAHCSRGAASVGANTRGGRDAAPELLLTLVVAAALLGAVRQVQTPPSGAPREPVSGRQQLVALGIARI